MSRSAYHETRAWVRAAVVQGRDAGDIVVVIHYSGPGQAPLHDLPVRIYGW